MHAAIAKGLMKLGTDVLFGLTGSGNLFIAGSFVEQGGGRFVRAAHEAGAVQMAQGYAKVSGRLAVVTVSMGPGLTNTLTGLVEGTRGRTPVLVMATDAPTEEKFHWQAIDQAPLVMATGAGFELMRSARTAMRDLARAAQRAVTESRPIVLDIPRNLLHETVEDSIAVPRYPLAQATRPAPELVEEAVGVIAGSQRPLIVAGRGAIQSRKLLLQLAERLGAPVATTLKAKGLFAGSPSDIGIFGTLSTELASSVIARADCVLVFGATLNYRTTMGGDLVANKRIVQIDRDASAIGATRAVDVGIVADCGHAAGEILSLCDAAELGTSRFIDAVHGADAMGEQQPGHGSRSDAEGAHGLDAPGMMSFLNVSLAGTRTVVTDGGNFALAAWKHLDVADPTRFVTTTDFGAIGSGMGNAIGAACAFPDTPTLLITGDGGFMLGGIAEFNTAVRHRLDLIAVVCNNGSYGPEYHELANRGLDTSVSMFDWPEFADVARALGGSGVTVRTEADFARASAAISSRDRPLLLDVRLDPARDDSTPSASAT